MALNRLRLPTTRRISEEDKLKTVSLDARFWARVDASGDCWLWTGAKNSDGYGFVGRRAKMWKVHRFAWLQLVGEIPNGLELDHLCRTRACVNPDHLRLTTHAVNTLAGFGASAVNARKTHCINGHPFSPENTGFKSYGRGRRCRICNRVAAKRRYLTHGRSR